MKSDDKFYITLVVLSVIGLIAIVLLKDKKTPAIVSPPMSALGFGDIPSASNTSSTSTISNVDSCGIDIYVKKVDLDKYISNILKQKQYVSSLPSDVRVNSMYEGKEF